MRPVGRPLAVAKTKCGRCGGQYERLNWFCCGAAWNWPDAHVEFLAMRCQATSASHRTDPTHVTKSSFLDYDCILETNMALNIVILGWGSLLWDKNAQFDDTHEPWEADGPELKLEFSRISRSRSGALTLVIDETNGESCQVAFARSKRNDPNDTICDLRCREGTTLSNIGLCFSDGSRASSRNKATLNAIKEWSATKSFDVVVWTDLRSNFEKECGTKFTVDSATAHLQSLDAAAKSRAAEYVWRAPPFVATPLRRALQQGAWFKQ